VIADVVKPHVVILSTDIFSHMAWFLCGAGDVVMLWWCLTWQTLSWKQMSLRQGGGCSLTVGMQVTWHSEAAVSNKVSRQVASEVSEAF
jgi:hypothetical protein